MFVLPRLEGVTFDPVAEVRRPCDGRRSTYSWPNPGEEPGQAAPERLTWRITTTGPGTVMLQLVHEQLSDEFYEGVSKGWAAILSSMKTLLETGKPLVFNPKE